ncbi:MAG: hypothetical protein OXE84_14885 [Rhodobacteraceae bacterium]|nr:hypothetical protein [Paracoccaceae bacterium]MCY4196079.1 hypothetical protein [Paracoccaceae bacterium]
MPHFDVCDRSGAKRPSFCQAKGIKLAMLPLKGAKMNGAVDRMHATWRQVFDTVQDTATTITEPNFLIDTHLEIDNG